MSLNSSLQTVIRMLLPLALLPLLALPALAQPSNVELAGPPEDAEVSASGLASKVLQAGDGDYHPDSNDNVAVFFTGWTPDGVQFLDNSTRDKPAIFKLQEVFAGWREGIQLMVLNEKRRLWIPAKLSPRNATTGPKGSVVIDVELKGVLRVPNTPEDLQAPHPDASRTAFGVHTLKLEAGKGTVRPGPESAVILSYIGWGPDGAIFDSSIDRKRPTLFILSHLMGAFSDAVQLMVEGERRRFWIPAEVANGEWPKAPKGMLVFDVVLDDIRKQKFVMPETPTKKSAGT
jgi:peptidylprolyl isomerase